jgi:tetratricopeptide (TPR) repeat protein
MELVKCPSVSLDFAMASGFDPVACEKAAFALKREGKFADAAALFMEIVRLIPDWEEGGGAFNLAFCLEEIGDFKEALKTYELALRCDPGNDTFRGNYESLKRLIDSQR